MARPRLKLGNHGNIRAKRIPSGWEAQTYFRDYDGRTRSVCRVGKTKTAAEQNLQDALRERRHPRGGDDLNRDHSFAEAGGRWLAETKRTKAGTTFDRYNSRLHGRLIPALGELRLHECSTGVFDRYLARLAEELAPETVRGYRAVCSAVMKYAVRMGAVDRNPVHDVAEIRGASKPSRGLTSAERELFLARLDADERAVADDLPDLLRFMLGTGMRIGEAMAMRWFRVDLMEHVLVVGDNLVREKGRGLVLHSPKTEAGFRVLPMPDFVRLMLEMRYPGEGFGLVPVFGNAFGQWRDPNNTSRSIRKFRDRNDFLWFTSHVCRHTAATILDEQGLTPREISGYLGHARPSFTQDRYLDRRPQGGRAGAALQVAWGSRQG